MGPLHGLPIGIKDIIGTQDMPTECGTVLRKGMSESADAEVVNLLKISGAIIMGKQLPLSLHISIRVKLLIHMINQELQGVIKWLSSSSCSAHELLYLLELRQKAQ